MEKNANALENELIKGLSETMESVSVSTDKVSLELQQIFSLAVPITEKQLVEARLRKEKGTPPGKPNDPLGDQLSWTQLLDQINGVSTLYIITNDGDYFTNFNSQLYLNSYLQSELKTINPKLRIKLFNKLAEGLADYNKHKEIASLPDKNELERIIIEEPELHIFPKSIKYYGGGDIIPNVCALCNSSNSLSLKVPSKKGSDGKIKTVYSCMHCGTTYTDVFG